MIMNYKSKLAKCKDCDIGQYQLQAILVIYCRIHLYLTTSYLHTKNLVPANRYSITFVKAFLYYGSFLHKNPLDI